MRKAVEIQNEIDQLQKNRSEINDQVEKIKDEVFILERTVEEQRQGRGKAIIANIDTKKIDQGIRDTTSKIDSLKDAIPVLERQIRSIDIRLEELQKEFQATEREENIKRFWVLFAQFLRDMIAVNKSGCELNKFIKQTADYRFTLESASNQINPHHIWRSTCGFNDYAPVQAKKLLEELEIKIRGQK